MPAFKKSISRLNHNHQKIFEKLDDLDAKLMYLFYEGKVNTKDTLKRIDVLMTFIKRRLKPHVAVENILFNFIEKHIPRVEMAVLLLKRDHEEIYEHLETMANLTHQLLKDKDGPKRNYSFNELHQQGVYLVQLMRNHLRMEDEMIFTLVDRRLNADEKKALLKKMKTSSGWKHLN